MNVLQNMVATSDIFYKKENLPDVQVGDTVKIQLYLELPNPDSENKLKERLQLYQGVIIAKSGRVADTTSTITVRKMFQGVGIEKVLFLNSPWVKSIEVVSSAKVKRGKLYYLRSRTGKSARLKRKF
jgi:large subunit ribosomal protein L19